MPSAATGPELVPYLLYEKEASGILWIPQGSGDIAFHDATLNTTLLGFVQLFAGLETYQFQTSIGPVSSGAIFSPNIFPTFENIPTSQGSLTITSTSSNTFTAAVAPEPASQWLASAGFAALLLIAFQRRPGSAPNTKLNG